MSSLINTAFPSFCIDGDRLVEFDGLFHQSENVFSEVRDVCTEHFYPPLYTYIMMYMYLLINQAQAEQQGTVQPHARAASVVCGTKIQFWIVVKCHIDA